MNDTVVKLLCALMLTAVGFFGCGIPFFFPSFTKNRRLIAGATAFGGGALLGLAFFHLIPESTMTMLGLDSDSGPALGVPLMEWHIGAIQLRPAYIFMMLGFTLILFIEKVAFSSENLEVLHSHAHEDGHHHHHGHNLHQHTSEHTDAAEDKTRSMMAARSRLHTIVAHNAVSHAHEHEHGPDCIAHNHDSPAHDIEAAMAAGVTVTKSDSTVLEVAKKPLDIEFQGSIFTAYMMMVALCIHNLFEGIVVGIADSDAFLLAVAIIFHHIFAGLALCMGFVRQNVHHGFKAKVALGLFIASLPVGIFLGMILKDTSNLVAATLNCFASGVLVYVSICEIISEEFALSRHKRSKFVCYLAGLCVLCIVSGWEG